MKYPVFILFCAIPFVSSAQDGISGFSGSRGMRSEEYASGKRTIITTLGWESGLYRNHITLHFFGTDSTYRDTMAAIYVPMAAEYCFSDRLSAGIQIKVGRYVEDQSLSQNSTGLVDVFLSFHALKKKQSDLYGRFSLGLAQFSQEDERSGVKGIWSGGHVGLGVGYRQYFGRVIGVYVTTGFGATMLTQTSLEVGEETVDTADISWDFTLVGYELGFGLVARF